MGISCLAWLDSGDPVITLKIISTANAHMPSSEIGLWPELEWRPECRTLLGDMISDVVTGISVVGQGHARRSLST
jgi:hypothetical protein